MRTAGLMFILLIPAAAAAEEAPKAPATQPASQPASRSSDPFRELKVINPKDHLPPIRSIRIRDKRESEDRSRKGKISVTIGSSPRGAAVLYGGRKLGNTPLRLTAHRGSTPFDVVIRAGGYMTLRTRIRRKTSRSYYFKLTPAKIR